VGKKKSRAYRDLEVWKLAIAFVKDIYQTTEKVPLNENYGLNQQIKRAAVSFPSKIAEGQVRNFAKEFTQSLAIALGSAAELENQLRIAKEISYLSLEQLKPLSEYSGKDNENAQKTLA
jgi:four helix bundle protein